MWFGRWSDAGKCLCLECRQRTSYASEANRSNDGMMLVNLNRGSIGNADAGIAAELVTDMSVGENVR
jgi:hypothetical protein